MACTPRVTPLLRLLRSHQFQVLAPCVQHRAVPGVTEWVVGKTVWAQLATTP